MVTPQQSAASCTEIQSSSTGGILRLLAVGERHGEEVINRGVRDDQLS
jgi:hypothetical protein